MSEFRILSGDDHESWLEHLGPHTQIYFLHAHSLVVPRSADGEFAATADDAALEMELFGNVDGASHGENSEFHQAQIRHHGLSTLAPTKHIFLYSHSLVVPRSDVDDAKTIAAFDDAESLHQNRIHID